MYKRILKILGCYSLLKGKWSVSLFFPEAPKLMIRGSGDKGSVPVAQVTYKSPFKRKKKCKKLGQICL